MRTIVSKVTGFTIFLDLALSAEAAFAQPSGAELFGRACAQCHDSSDAQMRAPKRDAMRAMTPEVILRALQAGTMRPFAQQLSAAEQEAVAVHLAGRGFAQQAAAVASAPAADGQCTSADGGTSFASM